MRIGFKHLGKSISNGKISSTGGSSGNNEIVLGRSLEPCRPTNNYSYAKYNNTEDRDNSLEHFLNRVEKHNPALNATYDYDPAKSKQLLADAGYGDGFEVTMDCPNNRYVNDERICQAVASMLAKVGIKVDVLAQPKSKYFAKVLSQNNYDTSFYLLGWTPGSIDSHNVLQNLLACRNDETKAGQFNLGHYCNPKVDGLAAEIAAETDPAKRQALIDEAFSIHKDEVGHIPIHQQPLSWGMREGVAVAQRADNVLDFRNVVLP